ncbi:hypothetical protein [Streptomyces sp. NPDC002187]|uniref:hypothetical protein n=1 Tax=Streptomyces sp. NPDC002187 TaxID=3364637 RepID=UPI0036AF9FCF
MVSPPSPTSGRRVRVNGELLVLAHDLVGLDCDAPAAVRLLGKMRAGCPEPADVSRWRALDQWPQHETVPPA